MDKNYQLLITNACKGVGNFFGYLLLVIGNLKFHANGLHIYPHF